MTYREKSQEPRSGRVEGFSEVLLVQEPLGTESSPGRMGDNFACRYPPSCTKNLVFAVCLGYRGCVTSDGHWISS
jgi:hypothetical protein